MIKLSATSLKRLLMAESPYVRSFETEGVQYLDSIIRRSRHSPLYITDIDFSLFDETDLDMAYERTKWEDGLFSKIESVGYSLHKAAPVSAAHVGFI